MSVLPIRYVEPVFRPPSEAESLILPVTDGCSWNKCTFCEMYTAPQKAFRAREEAEVVESAAEPKPAKKATKKPAVAKAKKETKKPAKKAASK